MYDEIERLKKENDSLQMEIHRLQEEVELWKSRCEDKTYKLNDEDEDEVDTYHAWDCSPAELTAEIERLRKVEQRADELLKALDAKFPMPVRHHDVNAQMFNLRAILKLTEDK